MTDRSKQQLIPPSTSMRLPAVAPPRPSLPWLPSSGGGPALTETSRLRKDIGFLGLHASKLRAMADQAAAFQTLVEKRDSLALAISNLESLGERCEHQYEMGRLSRHNERQLALLNYEHDQLQAKIRNAAAELQLAQYQPQPPAPEAAPHHQASTQPKPTGLTPAEVLESLRLTPEFNKPEILQALSYILTARLHEKEKSG